MSSSEDILEERDESQEKVKIPFTQMLQEGVDQDGRDAEEFFGYPISCRFKHCKAVLDDEGKLKTHQHECHGRK